jgi:hypothetical protein
MELAMESDDDDDDDDMATDALRRLLLFHDYVAVGIFTADDLMEFFRDGHLTFAEFASAPRCRSDPRPALLAAIRATFAPDADRLSSELDVKMSQDSGCQEQEEDSVKDSVKQDSVEIKLQKDSVKQDSVQKTPKKKWVPTQPWDNSPPHQSFKDSVEIVHFAEQEDAFALKDVKLAQAVEFVHFAEQEDPFALKYVKTDRAVQLVNNEKTQDFSFKKTVLVEKDIVKLTMVMDAVNLELTQDPFVPKDVVKLVPTGGRNVRRCVARVRSGYFAHIRVP